MQRSFSYTLDVTIPLHMDNERVAQWLWQSGFAMSHVARPSTPDAKAGAALCFLTYWQYFYQSMLLEVGVPLFVAPTITVLARPSDTRYQLSVSVPELSGHYALYQAALQPSIALLQQFAALPYSDQTFNVLAKQAGETLYQPLKAASLSGISTIPLMRQAWLRNVPIQHLGMGIFQLGQGAKRHLLRKSSTEQDSVMGLLLSESKLNSASLFRSLGLPSAEHKMVQSIEQAHQAAESMGYPLVVKPEHGNRSEGITLDVLNLVELNTAFTYAQTISQQVLIEKQVNGLSYRLFVYQGELLYVHCNQPRCVIGDGASTIRQLLEQDAQVQRQRLPWQRYPEIPLDQETLTCLTKQSYTLEDCPEKGANVFVRKVASTQWGAAEREGTPLEHVHPENRRLALRVAKATALTTAGVDLIISDISRPWYEQASLITEVNYAPMMGVSEVSRLATPRLIERLFDGGNGRIPIDVFMGDEQALEQAITRLKDYQGQGVNAYLTSHQQTLDSVGDAFYLPFETLQERSKALLRHVEVEALILVVQTDEVLRVGAPLDQINSLTVSNANVSGALEPVQRVYQALLNRKGTDSDA